MRTQNRGRESGKPGPGSPSAAVLKELSKSKLHRETRLETVKMIPAPMWALACLSQKPSFLCANWSILFCSICIFGYASA